MEHSKSRPDVTYIKRIKTAKKITEYKEFN